MNQPEVLRILKAVGAVEIDENKAYIDLAMLFPHVWETSALCRAIARRFENDKIQTVVSIGRDDIGHLVAHHLVVANGPGVHIVGAQCDGSGYGFNQKFHHFIKDKQVVVVGDIVKNRRPVKRVIEAVRAVGGTVVGFGVICNCGKITAADLDIPKLAALVGEGRKMRTRTPLGGEKECQKQKGG